MRNSLDKLTIQGFKSIRELKEFELKKLNVLIGGNGAGKSNFISFFRMLRAMIDGNLDKYIRESGGASDIFYNGRKITKKMFFQTSFGIRGYRFNLNPTPKDSCVITDEARYYKHGTTGWWELGNSNGYDSLLVNEATKSKADSKLSKPVYDAISSWQIYHYHDTGDSAAMRNYEIIQDKKALRTDAANIAPYLLMLKKRHSDVYQEILNSVQLVIPFFKDFLLEPEEFGDKQKVNLSWEQKGSDYPMQPYHLSDGSIRFICLATALLQPNPPATIIIDEPELGLHPTAIAILAELIEDASTRTQVIVATQSAEFINYFDINDIVVVKRHDGQSTFERLDEKDFSVWLEEYSVGELWTKNVIAGGVSYE